MLRKFMVFSAAISISLIGNPDVSHAEDFDGLVDHWVPSITFALSVHNEDVDLVATNSVNSDFSFSGGDSRTVAALRFGAELMTPIFASLPAKPRFYGYAGLLWSTPGSGLERVEHRTTSVNDFRDADIQNAIKSAGATQNVSDIEGQGNVLTGRQMHNAWFFGLGSAFTFPKNGFSIRARMSLEYVGEQISTEGLLLLLTRTGPGEFDIHEFPQLLNTTQIQHSLGPGFELEYLTHLEGSLTFSFFTQTRFLWIVNDNEVKLTGETNFGQTAFYSYKRNRFNFRGGVGFRVGFRDLAFSFR